MEGREESWRKDGSLNVNLDYQNTAQSTTCKDTPSMNKRERNTHEFKSQSRVLSRVYNNGLITHISNALTQIEINSN